MPPDPPRSFDALMEEKLADSLASPLPASTPRRVYGAVQLPGKATAVIGMRRAGKTTFLHQLRRERLERGVRRERLPYMNFEDERLAGLQRPAPASPGRGVSTAVTRSSRQRRP